MNWAKLSGIAEILSSIAVLVTLVYLTIQIRQNTEALQANSRDAALENSTNALYLQVNEPELVLSRTKPNLSDTERVKLSAFNFALLEMTVPP
jgi:hypothetical protein